MEDVEISIDKMAEQLAYTILAQPQEEQEFVASIFQELINNDKDIWAKILRIATKKVCG